MSEKVFTRGKCGEFRALSFTHSAVRQVRASQSSGRFVGDRGMNGRGDGGVVISDAAGTGRGVAMLTTFATGKPAFTGTFDSRRCLFLDLLLHGKTPKHFDLSRAPVVIFSAQVVVRLRNYKICHLESSWLVREYPDGDEKLLS